MPTFTIKIEYPEKLEDALRQAIEKKLDKALNDMSDFIAAEADRILRDSDEGSFDTGFLAGSLVNDKDKFLYKEVGYGSSYAPYIEYGCFFDSQTKILTENGQINIKDIKENNIVLTHTGEGKKVLKYIEYSIDEIVTEYIIKIDKKYLRVTSEHPILVCENGVEKFKLAKDIKLNDEIVMIKYNGMDLDGVKNSHLKIMRSLGNLGKCDNSKTRKNLSCDKQLEWNKNISNAKKKYYEKQENRDKTGKALKNSKIFQDKMRDREYRNKVNSFLKKYYEGHNVWNKGLTKENNDIMKSISEKNSEYMRKYYKNNPEEASNRAQHMRKNSMFFNTKIELKVDAELTKNNIRHKNQYRVWDEIHRQFYTVDHYLPHYNLIIEDYGDYWHNFPKGNDADKKRINSIENLGYKVLILWENDIKNNKFIGMIEECIKNIIK